MTSTRIALHDCDAAGVLFAATLPALVHRAYEDALLAAGIDLAALIRAGQLALPVRSLHCDYRSPLCHGDRIDLLGGVAELRERSYRYVTQVIAAGGSTAAPAAIVEQVHVCVDRRTGKACALPAELSGVLSRLLLSEPPTATTTV